MEEKIKKAFTNWRAGAFYLKFPNGNELSTTFAAGSYSDNNRNYENLIGSWEKIFEDQPVESNTVEIMILKCPEKLSKKIHKKYGYGDNSVIGYLDIQKWLEIVALLSK